jgi:NAD(P)-dependent dehydrogenase (short-subunit alcohol dehydrogenase family)
VAQRFANKNIVVVGGNSGIGLATAKAFADEGGRVAIIGRNAASLAAAAAQLGEAGVAIQADMSSLPAIESAMAQVRSALGRVDVLFANAGTGGMVPFEQVTEQLWDSIMNVNVKGTYFTVQKCVPMMAEGGAVILCSSVSAVKSWPGASVYSASKAAINSLGRGLACELVGKGIRVNVVMPGGIDTPIMTRTPGVPPEAAEAIMEQMAAGTPMARIGQPDEVASAVLFLASKEASYITATELLVDGGVAGAT